MRSILFKQVDNAPLVVFRIFFGLLISFECYGAILTGWVKDILITPKFTFGHIGWEWLHELIQPYAVPYYLAMGTLGIFVAIGYKFKFSIGLFAFLWWGAYLMQKESYNNHYYLLLLISLLLWITPANKDISIDSLRKPSIKSSYMPAWCRWIFIAQISIVYFYATLAKFYPGWLDASFTKTLFEARTHYPIIGPLLFDKSWFHFFIAYTGILFDALIIPLLLYKKTRQWALLASILFHLFNAVVLHIGIFPFFALSFVVFFYPADTIRNLFLPRQKIHAETSNYEKKNNALLFLLGGYFIIQILLPLRHWIIKGDVLWTEEGHRLSWRMMLRQKSGELKYSIINKANGQTIDYDWTQDLTKKQLRFIQSRPDAIWQYAQRIKQHFLLQDIEVAIHATSFVVINKEQTGYVIDSSIDLASTPWNHFKHNEWILTP